VPQPRELATAADSQIGSSRRREGTRSTDLCASP
jgi:hypothetical protein